MSTEVRVGLRLQRAHPPTITSIRCEGPLPDDVNPKLDGFVMRLRGDPAELIDDIILQVQHDALEVGIELSVSIHCPPPR